MRKIGFVVRTVRNGRVKIFRQEFRPKCIYRSYDSRLDGLRIAFGLYWTGKQWNSEFVNCWGSEEMYRSKDEKSFLSACLRNPCLVDGCFPWEFWDNNVDRKSLPVV